MALVRDDPSHLIVVLPRNTLQSVKNKLQAVVGVGTDGKTVRDPSPKRLLQLCSRTASVSTFETRVWWPATKPNLYTNRFFLMKHGKVNNLSGLHRQLILGRLFKLFHAVGGRVHGPPLQTVRCKKFRRRTEQRQVDWLTRAGMLLS